MWEHKILVQDEFKPSKTQGLHLDDMKNLNARFESLVGIDAMSKAGFSIITCIVRYTMKSVVASRSKLFSGVE